MRKIYPHLFRKVLMLGLLTWALLTAQAQQVPITGTVTDPQGLGLPGVNVILKGTSIGTATDAKGGFTISASPGSVLVITFIGYETQEVTVGAEQHLAIVLTENIATLEEVVVVGYGEMKKANLTSAQTTVTAEALTRTVNTTLEQALQGRSSGVYITQNSGQPGGGISVNIRGINSISGSNEPLYVIDGVQMQQTDIVAYGDQSSSNPLAGLNPNDIESIDVLKGPSATAIYGSRGTNGVVIITTKRGKAGATKISYDLQYSVQTPPKPLEVMNLREYAQMVKEYHALAGGDTPVEFLDPSLLGEGTNWQEALFRNAPMMKHQLSVSGGNELTTYYLSGEYLDQEGIALGSGFDRYSIRLNLDTKPRDWVALGTNLSFSQTDEDLTTSQDGIIANALRLTPQVPIKNPDGSWGGGDDTNGANEYTPVNPVAIANLNTNNQVKRRFLGGLNLSLTPWKGLTLRTSLNADLSYTRTTNFQPAYHFGYQERPTSTLTNGSNNSTYWNWNQLIQYYTRLGMHSIDVMGSHEAQESVWENLSGGRTGFVDDDLIDLNLGDAATATNGGGQGDWAMESYFARLNYSYADKYILIGTIRTDGSVNFGPENKWGVFPSISAAWRISEESFFKVPYVNEFKLRVETGLTGNQGAGGGIYSPLQSAATPWGTGFLPSRYSNPALKWEETNTRNVAIDVGLFNNRLQITYDYYIKETDNLLLENPLPWYMGTEGQGSVGAPTVNIGSLRNKGWDLSIHTINIDHGGFTWRSDINVSRFKTTIQAFYSDKAAINRTSWYLEDWTQQSVVGRAPWLFIGYIEDGLFQSVDEINESALPVDNNKNELPINEDNVWVGDVKFRDISGPDGTPDGIIDVNDQTFIGNPYPKYFAGITNTFSYKGFDLSILVNLTQGNDIYNLMGKINTNASAINLSRNLLIDARNYAKLTTNADGDTILANPGTKVARISHGPNGNYERHTTRWVEDGSYVRIKNINLTYHLPAAWLAKQSWIKNARLGFSAQNVATFTRYSGYDPEVGAYIGQNTSAESQAIGVDYGRYPLTPVYTFSIGVDF